MKETKITIHSFQGDLPLRAKNGKLVDDEIDKKLDLQILAQELIQGLKVLTGTQQKVLILRFILGYTTPEIAQSLNKQPGAVRALQMRGLRKLAQYHPIRQEHAFDS